MRISMLALGTRGDVQPYVALGLGLKAAGYRVRIVALSPFRDFVTERGLEFGSLGGIPAGFQHWLDRQKLGSSAVPNHGLGARARLWRAFGALALRDYLPPLWDACRDADALIYSKAMLPAYFLARKLDIPCIKAYPVPHTPTRAFPSPLANVGAPRAGWYNRLSFQLEERFRWHSCQRHIARWCATLPPSGGNGTTAVWRDEQRVPTLYGYSPAVLPKPSDWPDWIEVTGDWPLDPPSDWRPSRGLLDFLNAGPPPIYAAFGEANQRWYDSMTRLDQRVIVHGSSGRQQESFRDRIFQIDAVPFDWLFPRLAGALHYGGAGTVASALRAGLPSAVFPTNADQPFWGARLHQLGLAPDPVPMHKLSPPQVIEAIKTLTGDQDLRRRTQALATRLRSEDGVARAVANIERTLGSAAGQPARAA